MTRSMSASGIRIVRAVIAGIVFLAVAVLMMIWLAGGFHRKIDSSATAARAEPVRAGRPIGDAATVAVRVRQVPRIEPAVGTVRAVHESSIASKLLAKVIAVYVTAGQNVKAGEVLMRLDDQDLIARAEQAEAVAAAAASATDQARIEYDRIQQLVEKQAASKIEWDRVQTALRTAEAEEARADQAVVEAKTVLSYATIRSPIDGVVIDKRVEVGDTATPGSVLLTLYDPTRMQLVASVRESLTRRLEVGQTIGVRIDTLDHTCDGRISEIVPEAESASRSFAVKVTGPCPPGVYSGMFGRLLIPLDEESVVVVPRSAVRRVGQLRLVEVVEGGHLRRRAVTLGRDFGDDVEVLSGLREGERVGVNPGRGETTP